MNPNLPYVVVAKQSISFEAAGLSDKVKVIYRIQGGILSWQPGRPINGILGFESGMGYYVVPSVELDLSALVVPPLEEAPAYDFEKYVTNAYYLTNALNQDGQPCVNGDAIYSVPDSVGDSDISYAGDPAPTLGIPKYNNGAMVVVNQPFAPYTSTTLDDPYALPEEMTIVFRKLPGTGWEAISATEDYYVAFDGETNMRIGNASTALTNQYYPQLYAVTIIHILWEPGGTAAKVWINGVYREEVIGSMTDSHNRSLSVHSNASDIDLIAKFYTHGQLSDSDRADYLTQQNSYFNVGSLPGLPYASNVGHTKSGFNYTAHYTYNGALPEDVSKVKYQWWEKDGSGGGFVYTPRSTQKNTSYTGSNDFRVTVQVFDTEGNTWHPVNGDWT